MPAIPRTVLCCALFTLFVAATARCRAAEIETLKSLFAYDATQPLDVQEKLVATREGVKVYDVTYASPKGGRATAYLVAPERAGRHAGILFGHWGGGTRTEFLAEAILYARAGAVCLLADYPWERPVPSRRPLKHAEDPESDHQTYVQAVVDLRRGLDLLAGRADVDRERIAYVGHSYGAQFGAILSAVDPRLKGAALVGGTPDAAAIWYDSDDPGIVEYRKNLSKEKSEAYLASSARTDAVRYVPHARCPLLMQFANFERHFNKASMERYAAAAREPKVVRWYDTGHELNDPRALVDRAKWVGERVGLGPIDSDGTAGR